MRPRAGICFPVRYRRCRDGDTIEVSLPQSDYTIAVRLVDCWCAEKNTPGGQEAKAFAEEVLEDCDDLFVFVPLSPGTNILKTIATFDRILGEVWISHDRTLNEMLVSAGLATATKGGKRE